MEMYLHYLPIGSHGIDIYSFPNFNKFSHSKVQYIHVNIFLNIGKYCYRIKKKYFCKC